MNLPKIVVAVLVEKDGKYLLVKEILEDNKEYWIIPGGKTEFGESLEQAVKRELKEETNLDIDIAEFIAFKEAIHVKHNYHTIIFYFLGKASNDEILLDDGILDAKFFTKEELKDIQIVSSSKWFLDKYILNKAS